MIVSRDLSLIGEKLNKNSEMNMNSTIAFLKLWSFEKIDKNIQ